MTTCYVAYGNRFRSWSGEQGYVTSINKEDISFRYLYFNTHIFIHSKCNSVSLITLTENQITYHLKGEEEEMVSNDSLFIGFRLLDMELSAAELSRTFATVKERVTINK